MMAPTGSRSVVRPLSVMSKLPTNPVMPSTSVS
jgi:hypothetical protein